MRIILIEYIKGEPTQETTQIRPEEEQEPSDTEDEESDTEEKLKQIAKKEQQENKQCKAHLIERGAKIRINVRRYEKEGQPLTQLTDANLYPHKTDKKRATPRTEI